ncbi:hypothetical protein CXG81DRAFT_9957 [Caulochytrium protostelioides]|uniref:hydroxymethylglutaryl-CoA reductase (NADPH) n=1 Tax=Caulochytrium protostelioides TaxID=1555241 RepID=A0A4P9XD58_9FUNG|nr:hypothetical protein CXG81DRAFT_9957 [Caulochytrium protostelioides]|eukprot:RKP03120.1 hypothetical protein CXG81DRAFT_9957 [Caulochytrium protostelioides]
MADPPRYEPGDGLPAGTPHTIWSGFYKKAIRERQAQLRLAFPDVFRTAAPAASASSPTTASAPSPPTPSLESPSPPTHAVTSHHPDAFPICGLSEAMADNMIENCIGTLGLPVGLALNFVINGRPMVVPLAVEEPSVVAAVSGSAKFIAGASPDGTFHASTTERNIMVAQIQLLDVPAPRLAAAKTDLDAQADAVRDRAESFCLNMAKRGGGVVRVETRIVAARERPARPNELRVTPPAGQRGGWLVVHIHLDVMDAMGANICSTVAEGVAPFLAQVARARVGLRIVSNYCTNRRARAHFRVPVGALAYKGLPGRDVARRLMEAYEWAEDDVFRATTHNKGIMNGVDAVAIATGQDWRAVEAAAHAFAARSGRYRPLTQYWIERAPDASASSTASSASSAASDTSDDDAAQQALDNGFFCGELELPLAVGTVGGVLKTNPVYAALLGMMRHPSAQELSMVMVSVGLAQNFAALRALVTEGIQRGHMALHARNVAVAAGASPQVINECVAYMIASQRITVNTAKEYLDAHELHRFLISPSSTDLAGLATNTLGAAAAAAATAPLAAPPSMFYFEDMIPNASGARDRLTLNIAFMSLQAEPTNLELMAGAQPSPLVTALFGLKSHRWLHRVLSALGDVRLGGQRSNVALSNRLKVLVILFNIITQQLLRSHPSETRTFVGRLLAETKRFHQMLKQGDIDDVRQVDITRLTAGLLQRTATAQSPTLSPSPEADARHDVLDPVLRVQDPVLRVGFPLLLSLWQVFEVHVLQYVDNEQLIRALLMEQRRVVQSLVSGLPPQPQSQHAQQHPHDARAAQYVRTIHKRYQTTLLLLTDATSLSALTGNDLQHLIRLGAYLEWEQTLAHDVSPPRIVRDLAACRAAGGLSRTGALGHGVVNGFLAWCALYGGPAGLDALPPTPRAADADAFARDPQAAAAAAADWVDSHLRDRIVAYLRRLASVQWHPLIMPITTTAAIPAASMAPTNSSRPVSAVSRAPRPAELGPGLTIGDVRQAAPGAFDPEPFRQVRQRYWDYYAVRAFYTAAEAADP